MTHLSTLTLHQLRYGELTDDRLAAANAHLGGCERCAARLRAQEDHRAAFTLQPVPAALKAPAAPRRRNLWGWLLAPAMAAMAAFAILPEIVGNGINTKGDGDHLEAWLDVGATPRALGDGDRVIDGDRIQLRYRHPPADWVTFAGEDYTGEIEVYGVWPADHEIAGWQDAPFALTLDDSPGTQVFYAVFTDERPRPREISAELLGHDALPDAIVESVELTKGR